jgi:hypothetical protein
MGQNWHYDVIKRILQRAFGGAAAIRLTTTRLSGGRERPASLVVNFRGASTGGLVT